MSNIKISELPLFTGNTAGAYLVMNNSGQTTTFKVTKETLIGASGTSGTSGSSGLDGSSGSSGTSGVSGSSGTSGSSGVSGTSGDSIFAQTGSFWNTTRNVGVSGSFRVSGSITSTNDITVNGLNIGRGAGSISSNISFGISNLINNTTGNSNVAIGQNVLLSNVSGSVNTVVGHTNNYQNQGSEITILGAGNLGDALNATSQIAIGCYNLMRYKGGDFNNMADGPRFTLNRLESGAENIAIGSYAMQNVRTGSNNTIVGGGAFANMTGSNNIGLGFYAGTNLTGSVNNTLIVDSLLRTNYPVEGLIYGVMNSTVANQTLRLNAATTITNNTTITGSLKVTEALNTRPLYYGTGSVYGNNFQNVPGTPGDIRIFEGDGGLYNLAFFTVSGSSSWSAL